MNRTIQQEIDNAIRLLSALEADEREYRGDPDPRQADRERVQAGFDERRRQTIESARHRITRERERHMREFEKARKTSFDPTEVSEAWRRIERLLDAGVGIGEIVARIGQSGFERSAAEAIRQNLWAWQVAKAKGRNVEQIDREVEDTLLTLLRHESPLMDYSERDATESFVELLAVEPAIEAFEKLAVSAQTTGRVGAQGLIALGLAEGAADGQQGR